MAPDPMIRENGNLQATIPCEAVTWFDFLYFSRATNSNYGGWNSQTHWAAMGLDRLDTTGQMKQALIAWTKNSARNGGQYLPLPRTENFMLDRENEFWARRGHLTGSSPSALGSITENELSARLYDRYGLRNGNPSKLEDISLVSYEVPLVDTQEGQLRIDLLGGRDGHLVLIELKQGSGTDSPLMALVELICYGTQISRFGEENAFWTELGKRCGLGTAKQGPMDFIIAAPADYWEKWLPNAEIRQECFMKMNAILAAVNGGLANPWQFHLQVLSLEVDSGGAITANQFFPVPAQ